MRTVRYVEIDVPFCELEYSVAPCEAELGVTGEKRCFNTRTTCQDIENFSPQPLTLRFAVPSEDLDPTIDAIPNVRSVSITPAQLDPGVSIGQRESVTVSFTDHPHSDAGLDKYVDQRSYDPFEQGTFWGKFRARHRSLKGQPLRIIDGEVGQALGEMTTRHYIIEDFTGLRNDAITITAKDALKLIDADRAQAPAISNGQLAANIDDVETSATLVPAGIGDAEYPASGKVAIGGSEICSFTRASDVLTLTRAQSNTEAEEHDAGDIVQLVLEYESESPADIIYDLMTGYSNFDPTWISLPDWQEEMETWIGRLYSAEIAEPVAVTTLVSELIEQVGLVLWFDVVTQTANLTALRPVSATASIYDIDRIWAESFSAKEQPKKRVSQVWTYFGQRNPLARLDEPQNFRAAVATIDPDDTEAFYDEQPAIKKIYSRWIDAGNRPAASRLNELLLARYSTPPRMFSWVISRVDSPPQLGRGARIRHYQLQDDQGGAVTAPAQITSINPTTDRYLLTAEEMLFAADDIDGEKIIILDADAFDINLRDIYDQFYAAPQPYDNIVFNIESGVQIGGELGGQSYDVGSGESVRGRAVSVGDWPDGVDITINVFGGVHGKGGEGGSGQAARTDGGVGGTGIYTRTPIKINNQGTIRGGGGGGGGDFQAQTEDNASGGGGAGYIAGIGGFVLNTSNRGEDGTLDAGGDGALSAGDGGDPGQPGGDDTDPGGQNGIGGDGGYAIDGVSFVTWINEGDVVGQQVN